MTAPAPGRGNPPPTPTFAGTPPFPQAARTALADAQLRTNLAAATKTIRTKRARAVEERADWEALRLAGAAIKDEVIRDLPALLERLEANVTAAGGTVHWARDAAEANAIVARLVREAGADEVIKVKSMVTQEIELNEALAKEGIAAWETDLAELIVQLGGDLPSHILVPAIHRNRREIREIFEREMARAGRPAPADLTDEPRALAEAARLHLREKFLRAKVAISGANFAVADTGTVMVVESEGNGRMCLTLPETLITVMGIEKLVPRWQDLEVFLQLLPRSSTAERMNPYTSMWTGVTAGDGPQAFHLVLLDNGRTDTLVDPVGRQALRCIKCSACLNVCPVYERTGGRAYGSPYPGPIGAILTPQLRGVNVHPVDAQTASLPYASSLCGACFDVCPVRIEIPEILVHLRATVVEQHGWRGRASEEAVLMAAAGWTFRGPSRLSAAERVGGLGGRVLASQGRIRRAPGPGLLRAWLRGRDLAQPPRESFRRWWRRAGRAEDRPRLDSPGGGSRDRGTRCRDGPDPGGAHGGARGRGRRAPRLRDGAAGRDGPRGAVRRARRRLPRDRPPHRRRRAGGRGGGHPPRAGARRRWSCPTRRRTRGLRRRRRSWSCATSRRCPRPSSTPSTP